MTSASFSIRIALAVTALSATACNNDPATGSLSVAYRLGPGLACDSVDPPIANVRITLDGDKYDEEEACDPDAPIVFTGVAAGNYDVLAEGIDAEGVTVMDNVAGLSADDKVEVVGGSDKEHNVTLADTPAQVQVRWTTFVDGQFAQCAFATSKYFEVTAFHGANPFFDAYRFDCEVPPGYQALPDPMREIDGKTLSAVVIRVLDENQDPIGDEMLFDDFDPPGPGRAVKIDITCDGPDGETECTGEVVGIDAADTGADTGSTEGGDTTG
jgi:hypothetical protein